ncbi:MBG domain-containing protein [Pseudomonas aeruginosa]|nr:MBG domain-containing protein [Pseudomonas aeruginosa]
MTYQVSGLKNGDSAGQVLAGGLGRVGGEAVGQYDILQGGLALTSGNYQLNYQGNLLSILPLPVTPGDLGQLAALSDLRELQKGRDPDTPGDAVYRTTTLENPFLENPFLRAYALGMDVSDPNLLPATAAGPAEDASAKRVGQFTDRPLRAEAEWGGLLEPELPGRLLELLQQASEFLTLFRNAHYRLRAVVRHLPEVNDETFAMDASLGDALWLRDAGSFRRRRGVARDCTAIPAR